jgi:hypothetical protein
MENVVQVEQKSVYGVDKLYPANALAVHLAIFKGQKTLTNLDVSNLKAAGFQVERVVNPGHGDNIVLEVL